MSPGSADIDFGAVFSTPDEWIKALEEMSPWQIVGFTSSHRLCPIGNYLSSLGVHHTWVSTDEIRFVYVDTRYKLVPPEWLARVIEEIDKSRYFTITAGRCLRITRKILDQLDLVAR